MPQPRILCVDNHNDGRSTFTQAYLELLRACTANTTISRTWLFKDITSAGALIASDFSRKHSIYFTPNSLQVTHQSRSNASLRNFGNQGTYESMEKRTIMSRVGNRRIRGLRATDFARYDYIICFDLSTFNLLGRLRRCAEHDGVQHTNVTKIQLVDFPGAFHEHADGLNAAKAKLRDWAKSNLGFRRPERDIKGGPWRTRQVVITEAGDHALLRSGAKRLNALKAESGCDFRFGEVGDGSGGWVVSIVGKVEKVDNAAWKVLETW
jgi:hypothetical protein